MSDIQQQIMQIEQEVAQFHRNIEAIQGAAARQIKDNEMLIASREAELKNLRDSLPKPRGEEGDVAAKLAALEAEIEKMKTPTPIEPIIDQ